MNARNLIVAASVFAAAGRVLAGDADPFGDSSQFMLANKTAEVQTESAQASPDADFVDVRLAAAGYSANEYRAELEREYAKGQSSGAQNAPLAHTDAASGRSREEVRAEATQAAKQRMTKGVTLLPGDAW
jgi:hypothetical protein